MKDSNLLRMIGKQINFNKGKNIFYECPDILLKPSKEFKEFILANIENILSNINDNDYIESILKKVVNLAVAKLYEINQFINIMNIHKEELKKIYRQTLNDICNLYIFRNEDFDKSIDSIFKEYYIKLKNFIIESNGENLFKSYRFFKHAPLIVNSDYTDSFQMKLLNLNIDMLEEPILDIGCGYYGNLVNFLRKANKKAYGIDRHIKKAKYSKKIDWLDFKYKKRKWGTIIAHMSFSNHLIHHYVKKSDILKKYVEKYFEIINSLKINGAFIYAPGLPFIENELINDNSFQIVKKDVLYKGKALNSVVKVIKIK